MDRIDKAIVNIAFLIFLLFFTILIYNLGVR